MKSLNSLIGELRMQIDDKYSKQTDCIMLTYSDRVGKMTTNEYNQTWSSVYNALCENDGNVESIPTKVLSVWKQQLEKIREFFNTKTYPILIDELIDEESTIF